MSTKVYNAFLWNDGDVLLWLKDLKALYLKDAPDYLEKALCLQNRPDWGTTDFPYTLLKEIEKASAGVTRDPLDLEFSCVVYRHRRKTVVQFFGLDRFRYPQVYKKVHELKDYSYWNNTDAPDGVSQSLFDRRGAWYESLYKKYGSDIPSECGLSYEFGGWSAYNEIVFEAIRKIKKIHGLE